ncbi:MULTISPECIES: hypothetical protein [Sinorhizobium]|uniref:Uncharacterized protein n=1 Tax=Rhizobium fredii TaxID=380 RepID=A0A844AH95_RHIFR|nr:MULTISPECIES: hypothetical protein [Sinorhizobium]MQX12564.1 hypothetical protein [Sinorhizobium fredii]
MSKSQLGGYDEERVPGACGRCVWDSQTARSILRLLREQLFLLDGRVAARLGGRTSAYEGRRFRMSGYEIRVLLCAAGDAPDVATQESPHSFLEGSSADLDN